MSIQALLSHLCNIPLAELATYYSNTFRGLSTHEGGVLALALQLAFFSSCWLI